MIKTKLKSIGGYFKYWYIMYRCDGFLGLFWMLIWPNKSGTKPNYLKVWEDKSL